MYNWKEDYFNCECIIFLPGLNKIEICGTKEECIWFKNNKIPNYYNPQLWYNAKKLVDNTTIFDKIMVTKLGSIIYINDNKDNRKVNELNICDNLIVYVKLKEN